MKRSSILETSFASTLYEARGGAADGRMYRDDDDNRVKLDRRGRVFRVGADGWRLTKAFGRPSGVDPDVWVSLRPILLKENKTYEEFKAEAEASNKEGPSMAMAITEKDLVSPKFTLIEIFAGSARITTACRDVGLATGPPIDINTGYDLLTKRDQDDVWDIIKNGLPTVIFMAPVCTSWSSLSNVLPEAERLRRRAASYPLVEFCAELATYQQQRHRYFIIENPETSQMWNTEPMRDIENMTGVQNSSVHMCGYGLKDPNSGMAMKKPMSFLHNIPMELFSRVIRRCRGDHEHQRIEGASPGHGSRAVLSQIYPWSFCKQLAEVITRLQERFDNSSLQICSPAIDEDLGHWVDIWEELAKQVTTLNTI